MQDTYSKDRLQHAMPLRQRITMYYTLPCLVTLCHALKYSVDYRRVLLLRQRGSMLQTSIQSKSDLRA